MIHYELSHIEGWLERLISSKLCIDVAKQAVEQKKQSIKQAPDSKGHFNNILGWYTDYTHRRRLETELEKAKQCLSELKVTHNNLLFAIGNLMVENQSLRFLVNEEAWGICRDFNASQDDHTPRMRLWKYESKEED